MVRCRFSPIGLFDRFSAICILATTLVVGSASFGHEGHDHDDGARAALIASTYPRVTAKSELYEIVGILKDGRLSIYLDQLATNEAVGDAHVKVAIGDREPVDAEPAPNATYSVAFPAAAAPESFEVIFTVNAQGGDDLLVGAMKLPQAASSDPVVSVAPMPWLAAVPAPLRNPFVIGVAAFVLVTLISLFRKRGRLGPALATGAAAAVALVVLFALAGSGGTQNPASRAPVAVMSDAPRRLSDGSAFVAKPTQRLLQVQTAVAKPETVRPAVSLIGRVIGDPNRTSVVQSVHGGRVTPLATGMPRIGQAVSKGDALAQIDPYLPLADRTTISEKTGEIEQLIAVAEIKLRRLRPLAERGAVPQGQVADLEAELEGLRVRRETIRNTRTELEVLRAPTEGVIAAVKVVPGQVVQAQDLLFQIVDPKGLWVEALAYGDVDLNSLSDASAVTTGGQKMTAIYQGFSPALQQHASVVQFAIQDTPPNLSIGQPVTVIAKTGAPVTGLLARRDAVMRNANGETIVWLHAEPEVFEARPVRTESFDAAQLIIAGGVSENERIVIRGADLINQIR